MNMHGEVTAYGDSEPEPCQSGFDRMSTTSYLPNVQQHTAVSQGADPSSLLEVSYREIIEGKHNHNFDGRIGQRDSTLDVVSKTPDLTETVSPDVNKNMSEANISSFERQV